jgi:hypothetical protein
MVAALFKPVLFPFERWTMTAIIVSGFGVIFGMASWLSDKDLQDE